MQQPFLCPFLIVVFLVASVQAQPQAVITGTVTDAETGEPLFGVHVFLSGTTVGTTTDADGKYRLAVTPGIVRLTASFLGYHATVLPLTLTSGQTLTQNLRLRPDPFLLDGLTVTAERDRQWERNLERFTNGFLGLSQSAEHTEILNPEVLSFDHPGRRFTARAAEPLRIVNRALGYELDYVLQEYVEIGDQALFRGEARFQELAPEDERQAQQWAQNRAVAFRGSLRHFLIALLHDRVDAEGFMATDPQRYAPNRMRSNVRKRDLVQPGPEEGTWVLSLVRPVEVVYTEEYETAVYLRWLRARANEHAGPQRSGLSVRSAGVFDADGVLLEPFAVTRSGYMAFERVAEMLPREYRPEDFTLTDVALETEEQEPYGEALVQSIQMEQWLKSGAEAYQQERYEEAERLLRKVFNEDPAFIHGTTGSVAYWLSQTLWAQGENESATQVAELGLDALDEAELFDSFLADIYVRRVFTAKQRERYERATRLHTELLTYFASSASDVTSKDWHIGPLKLLLSDSLLQAMGLHTNSFTPDAAETVAQFWRGRDPMPATNHNERLAEHLERSAYAWTNLTHRHPTGRVELDGRACLYIRFGEPYYRKSLTLGIEASNPNVRQKVVFDNPRAGAFDFPKAELWTYQHVHGSAQYLLVQKGDEPFREGTTYDLLPEAMMNGAGNRSNSLGAFRNEVAQRLYTLTAPGPQSVIYSLYGALEQLAMHHGDYALLYDEVGNYVFDLEANVRAEERKLTGGGAAPPPPLRQLPNSYAMATSQLFRSREEEMARQRDKQVPQEHTELFEGVLELPVSYRLARFLASDGTTRPVLYWMAPASALPATEEQMQQLLAMGQARYPGHLLRLSARQVKQQTNETAAQVVAHRYYAMPIESVPVVETELAALTQAQTLALQWDQFLAQPSEANPKQYEIGPQLRLTVPPRISLSPLNANESVLEMSDLLPRRVLDGGEILAWPVIVGDAVNREVALSFELYHLVLDGEGHARFSVEVEVSRVQQGGVLERIFGRGEQRTSSAADFIGESRTAREAVIVDLAEAKGEVVVTVRVTDQLSGQQAERQISLKVALN